METQHGDDSTPWLEAQDSNASSDEENTFDTRHDMVDLEESKSSSSNPFGPRLRHFDGTGKYLAPEEEQWKEVKQEPP